MTRNRLVGSTAGATLPMLPVGVTHPGHPRTYNRAYSIIQEAGNHPTVRVAAGFSTISAHCGQPDARSREVTGPDNGEWPPLIVNSI